MDDERQRENTPDGSEGLDGAMRELADRIPLVKAYLAGKERVAPSNALPWTDVDQREQALANMGAIPPPYDPETLAILFENSSSLRQNVDAYVTNIDAFGHRLEPVIDLDASDADHRIANALYIERMRDHEDGRLGAEAELVEPTATATPDEVAAAKKRVTQQMRIERSKLE